ncbi:MAG: hypothetical protein Q9205_002567 [Flavoplaca limonia]
MDCNLSPFPRYVVNASSASHVAEAVKFASRTGVRVIVKGGAHDLLGRCINRTVFNVHLDATYLGYGIPCIIFPFVMPSNPSFQSYDGAADPNVGMGGFLTGGGHSPIGSKYGLGVDNVLEIMVVTPDGILRQASVCQNPDIFWAVRGGGAFTFGVLISATLKIHPIPPITGALLSFNSTLIEASESNNTNFYSITAYLHSRLPDLSAAGLMGYYSITPLSPSPVLAPVPLNFAFLIYTLSSNTTIITHTLAPIMARLNSTSGLTTALEIEPPTDFLSFQSGHFCAAPVGENYLPGTRLWDAKAVRDTTSLEHTLRQFQNNHLQGTFVSGAGVQTVPANESAVNPAWRRTVVDMMSKVSYPYNSPPAAVSAIQGVANHLNDVLRAQAPDMGCYVNEASIFEPNYRRAFWGEHYDRLLSIKRRIDPQGVFWCSVCVGGEDWEEGPDGVICKV